MEVALDMIVKEWQVTLLVQLYFNFFSFFFWYLRIMKCQQLTHSFVCHFYILGSTIIEHQLIVQFRTVATGVSRVPSFDYN